MAQLGTAQGAAPPSTGPASASPPSSAPSAGSIRRRRHLPGGRAVVGGLLVSAAAVGTFGAWAAASGGPASAYVTVARDLRVGDRLERDDLRLVRLDLPDAQRAAVFTDVALLEGAVVLAALGVGELVQSSAVAKPAGGPGTAQLSFAVPASDALGGRLKPGERVDLVAVYGTGSSATVHRATQGALLVDLTEDGGPVGGGAVTLTVAVPIGDVEAVALASSAATLKVVRTTNAAAA